MIFFRPFLLALGFVALAASLSAHDGQLLEAHTVTFTAKALAGMAGREPAIGEILEATTRRRANSADICSLIDYKRIDDGRAHTGPSNHTPTSWTRSKSGDHSGIGARSQRQVRSGGRRP